MIGNRKNAPPKKCKKIKKSFGLQSLLNDLYQFIANINTLNSKRKHYINSDTCLSYFDESI